MVAGGQPISTKPTIVDEKLWRFRLELIKEEVRELEEALETGDLIEVGDAFADIRYVLGGAEHTFGFADIMPTLFAEVHRSNMTKYCTTVEEAKDTVGKYLNDGIGVHYEKVGDVYVIYRNEDNKVLKSINYSPANLREFIHDKETV